ncbi:hypothetical protein [Phyllobacterium sp. OV277]|uniref:hypothetical protein n=1 Tax=Phyllobacterium sp. OV277 TaxID=1882772 RepID=UPI00088A1B3D|nr:hypothetical protein [Phyllobacterium sp. OV277]SDP09117.1 hypothetical protein SAMN05443582_103376 [Phyllobacterium sp. OV277]
MSRNLENEYPEEYAAFEKFRTAKLKMDGEFSFENARVAKQAWIDFLNVYQPTGQRLYPVNVAAFPSDRIVGRSPLNPKGAA